MGSVYLRGKVWWIKYYVKGSSAPVRLSSRSQNREHAVAMLKQMAGSRTILQPEQKQPGIYCLYCPSSRLTKIGKARNLMQRIRHLENMNGSDLVLVAYAFVEDPHLAESAMHHRLANRRIRGEWFDVTITDIQEAAKAGSVIVPVIVPALCPKDSELCGSMRRNADATH